MQSAEACGAPYAGGDERLWGSSMARTKRLRVGVLFGGRSSEHEVSLRSALTVMSAMDPARYEIVPIGIARDGRWRLRADAIALLKQSTPKLHALGHTGVPVLLAPYPDHRSLQSISIAEGIGRERS